MANREDRQMDPTDVLRPIDPDSTVQADQSTTSLQGQRTPHESAGTTGLVYRVIGRLGDYELLGEIARGGMGVVYKARQISLKRMVAVKTILHGLLADERDIRRFRMEAEAAAQLQHPNIVSIHEVGECDGQHFFSMEYVEGSSLASLARKNPLRPAEAAAYVKQIADAIHYAHSRGVLHRDVKPSNVLMQPISSDAVGGPGNRAPKAITNLRPRITDFGLAKRTEAGSELTGTGQILGTPSFMPPEQAAGQWDQVGPWSDVYGLGATLYDLLTGRPPFRADSPVETLRQVLENDTVPPRILNPAVDRDLDTIVCKCLHKDRMRRYGTAQELADDLGRYLCGAPIVARPVSWWETGMKWSKRKPAAAALIATVALVLCGSAAAGLFVNRQLERHNVELQALSVKEREQAEEARLKRDEADRERTRAALNFTRARETVDTFFVDVSQDELLNEPGMQPLRERLLKQALKYYQDFADEHSEDLNLRDSLASAFYRVGYITGEVDSATASIPSYEKSAAIWEELLEGDPENLDLRRQLAQAHNNLAGTYRNVGQIDAAERSFQRARELNESVAELLPDNIEVQIQLARCYYNIAMLQKQKTHEQEAIPLLNRAVRILEQLANREARSQLGHVLMGYASLRQSDAEGIRDFQRAIEIFKEVSDENPRLLQPQEELANSYAAMGARFRDTVPEEAAAAYRQCIEIREALCRSNPEVKQFHKGLGDAYDQLAWIHFRKQQLPEAQSLFERARDLYEPLVASDSKNVVYKQFLATIYNGIALVERDSNEPEKSLESFHRALALQESTAADNPATPVYALDLAGTHSNIGRLHRIYNQNDKAMAAYDRAREIVAELIRRYPDYINAQHVLGLVWFNIADLHAVAGNRSKSLDAFQQARSIDESLVRLKPDSLLFRSRLCETLINISHATLEAGDYAGCLSVSQQVYEILQELLEQKPQSSVFRGGLAIALNNMGVAYQKTGKADQSLAAFRDSIEAHRAVYAVSPQRTKIPFSGAYRNIAALYRELNRAADAAAATMERKQLWHNDADELFIAACEFALCVLCFEDNPLSPEQSAERQKYSEMALESLDQAVQAGFNDLDRIEKDPNLDPIRGSPQYNELIQRLRQK